MGCSLKGAAIRQRRGLLQLGCEVGWQVNSFKTARGSSLEDSTTIAIGISRVMHVGAHKDSGILVNGYHTAGAGEGLFVNVTVEKDAPVKQFAVFVEHFPPVRVLITPCIGALDGHRKTVRSRVTACFDGDYICKVRR